MSIKKNIQAFREWAYDNRAYKKETTEQKIYIDPSLNSKERNRLKWKNRNQ